MHVSANQKHKVKLDEWLKITGMVRVVAAVGGVYTLEVKAVPNSVRRRKKRRGVDNSEKPSLQ
jgi:hypothetical protein